jgi:hypothetical protein
MKVGRMNADGGARKCNFVGVRFCLDFPLPITRNLLDSSADSEAHNTLRSPKGDATSPLDATLYAHRSQQG